MLCTSYPWQRYDPLANLEVQNFAFPVTFTTCPLPTIWAHCKSDTVDEGVDWTGLCCWLGFCSGKPAAFLLWAAIWDKTLSALPPRTKNKINPVQQITILKCLLSLKHSLSFKNWLDEARDLQEFQPLHQLPELRTEISCRREKPALSIHTHSWHAYPCT